MRVIIDIFAESAVLHVFLEHVSSCVFNYICVLAFPENKWTYSCFCDFS